MADPSTGEFRAIYKKARRVGRKPRPELVNAVEVRAGGAVASGTIRIKPRGGLGPVSLLLGITVVVMVAIVLGINGFELRWLDVEVPGSIRMRATAAVATDSQAWVAMREAERAGDQTVLSGLRQEGRIFTLAQGRSVRLAGVGLTGVRVRALEGQDAGRTGWVPFSSVGIQ